MGSMWCKPSQFTDDCSPKLNIHSILSRLSSQICPGRCRYSHAGSRTHTKQRPRNEAVSKGCRPVISHPLMQPIPPPRKKRKHIQDLSRSEEHLCSSHMAASTPLRAANSLPVLCVPISQLKTKHNQEPLESITEEAMPSIMREMEDMESLPISEVYFLRKDGNKSAPVFDAVPKDVAEKTMTMEISGITNMANSNFLDRSNTICGQIRIDTEVIERITDNRKEIIETETITRIVDKKSGFGSSLVCDNIQRSEPTRIIIDKRSDCTNLVGDNIQRSEPNNDETDGNNRVIVNNVVTKTDDVNNSCDSIENVVEDSVDSCNGKKRQDAMKSKWLQNILIGSDASEHHMNTVGDNNSIPSFIPKDLREDVKNEPKPSQNLNEAEDFQNVSGSKLVEGSDGRVSRLIVTPECLNETLQRLNTSKVNRDELLNSRNLVFNSQNILKVNESSQTTCKESNWLTVEGQNDDKKESTKNSDVSNSRKSSRRSSITDSLQEFESSIYEMLQESAAKANASDDDDSFIALHKQTLDSRQGTL